MPPPHAPDVRAPPLPRGLLFLGALWLVGSWLLSLGVRPPLQPSAASYAPGVRSMLVSTAIGLAIGWPLVRLSEGRSSHSVRRVLLDLVVLVALVQIVVWPLRLVTPWNTARTLAIDATLLAWTLLVGALIVVGGRLGAMGRTATMAVIALLVLGAPAVAALATNLAGDASPSAGPPALIDIFARLSPISATHILAGAGAAWLDGADLAALTTAAVAAALAWLAVAAVAVGGRATRRSS